MNWLLSILSYLLRLIGTFHLVYKRQCVLGSCQFVLLRFVIVPSTVGQWDTLESDLWRYAVVLPHLLHRKLLFAFSVPSVRRTYIVFKIMYSSVEMVCSRGRAHTSHSTIVNTLDFAPRLLVRRRASTLAAAHPKHDSRGIGWQLWAAVI